MSIPRAWTTWSRADLSPMVKDRRSGSIPGCRSVTSVIAELTVVPGEGPDAPYGLRAAAEDNHFTWMLNPWQAEQIAVRIEALTPPELKSGNDIVELGLEGEIPVKISRGEFTNNFLTPQHHLDPDYRGATSTDT